jgi:hypothetical protein
LAAQCAYKVVEAEGEYEEFAEPTKVPPVAAVYQPLKVYPLAEGAARVTGVPILKVVLEDVVVTVPTLVL